MSVPEIPKLQKTEDLIDDKFSVISRIQDVYGPEVPFSEMVKIDRKAKLCISAYTRYFYDAFTEHDGTPPPPMVAEPFYLSLVVATYSDPSGKGHRK